MMVMVSDPAQVLEHAQQLQKKAQRAQDLEIENQQLRGRLDEYNSEFAEVKNQGRTVLGTCVNLCVILLPVQPSLSDCHYQ